MFKNSESMAHMIGGAAMGLAAGMLVGKMLTPTASVEQQPVFDYGTPAYQYAAAYPEPHYPYAYTNESRNHCSRRYYTDCQSVSANRYTEERSRNHTGFQSGHPMRRRSLSNCSVENFSRRETGHDGRKRAFADRTNNTSSKSNNNAETKFGRGRRRSHDTLTLTKVTNGGKSAVSRSDLTCSTEKRKRDISRDNRETKKSPLVSVWCDAEDKFVTDKRSAKKNSMETDESRHRSDLNGKRRGSCASRETIKSSKGATKRIPSGTNTIRPTRTTDTVTTGTVHTSRTDQLKTDTRCKSMIDGSAVDKSQTSDIDRTDSKSVVPCAESGISSEDDLTQYNSYRFGKTVSSDGTRMTGKYSETDGFPKSEHGSNAPKSGAGPNWSSSRVDITNTTISRSYVSYSKTSGDTVCSMRVTSSSAVSHDGRNNSRNNQSDSKSGTSSSVVSHDGRNNSRNNQSDSKSATSSSAVSHDGRNNSRYNQSKSKIVTSSSVVSHDEKNESRHNQSDSKSTTSSSVVSHDGRNNSRCNQSKSDSISSTLLRDSGIRSNECNKTDLKTSASVGWKEKKPIKNTNLACFASFKESDSSTDPHRSSSSDISMSDSTARTTERDKMNSKGNSRQDSSRSTVYKRIIMETSSTFKSSDLIASTSYTESYSASANASNGLTASASANASNTSTVSMPNVTRRKIKRNGVNSNGKSLMQPSKSTVRKPNFKTLPSFKESELDDSTNYPGSENDSTACNKNSVNRSS